jgi:hypothetical protein
MNRILVFYTISVILLAYLARASVEVMGNFETNPSLYSLFLLNKIQSHFHNPSLAKILLKLALGTSSKLHYTYQKTFNTLHLWSVLSFNSLHYFLITNLLQKIKKRLKNKYHLFILSSLAFLTPSLNILRLFFDRCLITLKIKNRFIVNHKFYWGFLFVSILGFFSKEIYSLTLGFIFVGTYSIIKHEEKFDQLFYIILSNLLVCLFLNQSFSLTTLALNILFFFLFKKIYPAIFLFFLLSLFFRLSWIEKSISLMYQGLHFLSLFSNWDATPNVLLIILGLLWSKYKRNYLFFFMAIVLNSNTAFAPAIYYSR